MIQHWENSDKFDEIRDKSNDNFDEIGKIKRDEDSTDLEYISDILIGNKGVKVDHSNPDGSISISLDGISSSNSASFIKVNSAGDGIQFSKFDIQTKQDTWNTLLPDSGGSTIAGPLTTASGGLRTYIVTAEIQFQKDSTTPDHELQIRRGSDTVTSIRVKTEGKTSETFSVHVTNVSSGEVFSVRCVPIGSTNQYTYGRCRLTLLGIPVY